MKKFANINNIKVGDKLKADAGFSCMKEGQIVEVVMIHDALVVPCRHGYHWLDGQVNEEGDLIGLYACHD